MRWFVSPTQYRGKSWIPSISISEQKVGQLVTSRSGRFYTCFTEENVLEIVAVFEHQTPEFVRYVAGSRFLRCQGPRLPVRAPAILGIPVGLKYLSEIAVFALRNCELS